MPRKRRRSKGEKGGGMHTHTHGEARHGLAGIPSKRGRRERGHTNTSNQQASKDKGCTAWPYILTGEEVVCKRLVYRLRLSDKHKQRTEEEEGNAGDQVGVVDTAPVGQLDGVHLVLDVDLIEREDEEPHEDPLIAGHLCGLVYFKFILH